MGVATACIFRLSNIFPEPTQKWKITAPQAKALVVSFSESFQV